MMGIHRAGPGTLSGKSTALSRPEGPLNLMDYTLKGLLPFIGIGFQYGYNEWGFGRPRQNIPCISRDANFLVNSNTLVRL